MRSDAGRTAGASRRADAVRLILSVLALWWLGVHGPTSAGAATYWQHDPASPGDWFEPANWTEGVPNPDGEGRIQNGGTAEVASGQATAAVLKIGYWGEGTVVQTGGEMAIGTSLHVGYNYGVPYPNESTGSYELHAGHLSAPDVQVGLWGGTIGLFVHSAGVLESDVVSIGFSGTGTYELSGSGELSCQYLQIGAGVPGVAKFVQTGGVNTVDGNLALGMGASSRRQPTAVYELGGTSILTTGSVTIGCDRGHPGEFVQTGGVHAILGGMYIGASVTGGSGHFSGGSYTIAGGEITMAELHLGTSDIDATFDIAGTDAVVVVTDVLDTGSTGVLAAVPGSRLHMSGASFQTKATDPAYLAGMANLTMIFEGGRSVTSDVEVCGWDVGPAAEGWTDNFALGTLQLGGEDAGRIRLQNEHRNHTQTGPEALYVSELILNPGAQVDLGGLNLYYLNGAGPKRFFQCDANLDGQVGIADLVALAEHYGMAAGAEWARGDFNGDGLVGIADLAALADHYGAATASATVPEPSAAMLIWAGLPAAWRLRRRRPSRK